MKGDVRVTLEPGPLPPATPTEASGGGAVLVFEGVVRLLEEGRPLAALVYEAYEPMTGRELTRLAERIAEEHALRRIEVEHSVGRVAVGETSFRLSVASDHRAAALAAVDSFINEMKRYVPLWKNPEWADGAS